MDSILKKGLFLVTVTGAITGVSDYGAGCRYR